MDTGMRTYGDELVAVLSAATAVLSDLPARVHRLTGPDLNRVLRSVDRLPEGVEVVVRAQVADDDAPG